MTRPKTTHSQQGGHVFVPSCAIGGLAILLATGLHSLGLLGRANLEIAHLVSRSGDKVFPRHLPVWALWLVTAAFALGIAFAMLGTPGLWRRAILWITSLVLVAAWAPVLGLAAHAPEISGPWIATLWSGFCAMVYSANHRMACDESPASHHEPS